MHDDNPYFVVNLGSYYIDKIVNDQSRVLQNLRFVRQQMEREEREVNRLLTDVRNRSLPRKWTPYHEN